MPVALRDHKCPTCRLIVIHKLETYTVSWFYKWFQDETHTLLFFCSKRCKRKFLELREEQLQSRLY